MKKHLSFVTIALAAALPATSVFAGDNHGKHEGKHDIHWSYHGPGKPENWHKLDEANTACKLSKEQSPIDIKAASAEKAPLPALAFGYNDGAVEIVNNGHTVQVNPANGGTLKIGADEFKFLQFHFHTPSEEKINGKAYPLVAHLVHKNEAGKLAVVAVLFKTGKENEALAPVFSSLPAKEGETSKLDSLNIRGFLPEKQQYFAFMGSLTTPPCSDGVRWHVMPTTVEISKSQLNAFKKLYKMNARPVQALNGRKIQLSQ